MVQSDIADQAQELVEEGKNSIEWASEEMPVLAKIRRRFREEQPLEDVRIGGCLHVTSETANLMRTLKAGGADVRLCASNPLSTQDEVASALVHEYDIPVFAVRGEDKDSYYSHIHSVLDLEPHITIDDGADLVWTLHEERSEQLDTVTVGMEETTTGVNRLRAMAEEGSLRYPMYAVNDAHTKYLFDNRYGTGQSTVDGILRSTNILFAGKVVVVSGYGWCGRGFAERARGMGARVIVTEVDHLRALQAHMDGFEVAPMSQACEEGDVFATFTGNTSVIRQEHFEKMKDGAILCNGGHFNVEIDIDAMEEMSQSVTEGIRPQLDRYQLEDGRSLYLLGEGRLVNLSCAEGHPSSVMDMSFATQSLMAEYSHAHEEEFSESGPSEVLSVPSTIEEEVARLKLSAQDISIDELTGEQQEYMSQAGSGT